MAIQEEVAQRVADRLGLELLPEWVAPVAPAAKPPTTRPEANLAYLRGCYYHSKASEQALRKSIECFERAIQLDPTFALAYCGLAYSYSVLGLQGLAGPPKECFEPAAEAARAAFRINEHRADPHVSLAIVKYLYEWDWAGAERLLRRALQLYIAQ